MKASTICRAPAEQSSVVSSPIQAIHKNLHSDPAAYYIARCFIGEPFFQGIKGKCTLRDLCSEDRGKVARLIKQVVELQHQVEQLPSFREVKHFSEAAAAVIYSIYSLDHPEASGRP